MNKKRTVITLAIALILALFVGYGIEVFHDSPDIDDFCNPNTYLIKNETACLEIGGEWQEYPPKEAPLNEEGFCDQGRRCYDQYELIRSRHDKIVFIVSLIIGMLLVILGIILKKETASTGILSGGVLLILYGAIRYWTHADKILKFILLGIALVILIWISYKKIDKSK